MSVKGTINKAVILGIVIGAVVGVITTKLMDGSQKAKAGEEQEPGRSQFNKQAETFRFAAKRIAPAVVNITNIGKQRPQTNPFFPFQDFYRRRQPRSANKYIKGTGSGFVLDAKNGYILTNNHVIAGGDEYKVQLNDDSERPAVLVGTDPQTDVAVLKIDPTGLTEASLGDSNAVQVGDWVLACGNPFGMLEQTVTSGIISAKGRRGLGVANYENFLQTDAAINQGNSGGPLVNLNGDVIGVNVAIFSKTGGYQGIGFAIPINQAKKIARKLIDHGKVVRGWVGIEFRDLPETDTKLIGITEGKGLLVQGVVIRPVQGPAYKAGLRPGDILYEFNNKPIKDGSSLRLMVADMNSDQKVPVKYLRQEGQDFVKKETVITITPQPNNWGESRQ